MQGNKNAIISQLQKDLLLWQGFKPPQSHADAIGLGPVESAFPNGVFPVGSIHEFVSENPEQAAASSGFMAGLLASLMRSGQACLWISVSRKLFPPALKAFGVEPDRILFADLRQEKDVLWAMEEALKCNGLAAVVGELHEIDFIQSRRLQLAVEKSKVTGFVIRNNSRSPGATACAARWRIRPAPSEQEEGMPGVGFPRWKVELLKVRNGNPGAWLIEWSAGRFMPAQKLAQKSLHERAKERKTG
ncbi:Error-prone repair protein ImuA [Anseongella ginsenosidimutans]|nr:Error-prone repair protein ImuA [Anseongella ginsenosidimutans]QEC54320.1 Error-prone repair protein ImuA [Anseongella ginsenosidimutans]